LPKAAGSATEGVVVAIALGSNVGDRAALVHRAASALSPFLETLHLSSLIETAPQEVEDQQRAFLNAALVGRTRLEPQALLAELLAIERQLGRQRPYHHAPRTIDLDLILFGELVLDEPGLTVPHPRFRERSFVLDPLAEIAPWLVDPVTGETVKALRDRLTSGRRPD
jgi:2-amino-4-hydroxy-6-hydroxymethyldihydropteridine diphosphokinase